jgi:competence CoiA-like predicted nuclease
MQYFAIDTTEEMLPAHLAEKGRNYFCPECGGTVRKRRSSKKRAHFYHLRDPKTRHQREKSPAHLAIQHHLFSLFPPGIAFLEHRFKEISRIADVAVPTKGLLFEIQCSPITLQEVEKRKNDYAALGLQIVWILHDKLFNKRTRSLVEETLRKGPCYYTDGKSFYDQADLFDHKRRLYRSVPYPIDLTRPQINTLATSRTLYFIGDVTHKTLLYPSYRTWLATLAPPKPKKRRPLLPRLLLLLYKYTHLNQNF